MVLGVANLAAQIVRFGVLRVRFGVSGRVLETRVFKTCVLSFGRGRRSSWPTCRFCVLGAVGVTFWRFRRSGRVLAFCVLDARFGVFAFMHQHVLACVLGCVSKRAFCVLRFKQLRIIKINK